MPSNAAFRQVVSIKSEFSMSDLSLKEIVLTCQAIFFCVIIYLLHVCIEF
jgi:hypothetical protein